MDLLIPNETYWSIASAFVDQFAAKHPDLVADLSAAIAGGPIAPEPCSVGYSQTDDLVVITVRGPITKRSTVWGSLVGATAADELVGALGMARTDLSVNVVVLQINSPGGVTGAIDRVARAIYKLQAEKCVVSHVDEVCAGAAYAISSCCPYLYASPMSLIGALDCHSLAGWVLPGIDDTDWGPPPPGTEIIVEELYKILICGILANRPQIDLATFEQLRDRTVNAEQAEANGTIDEILDLGGVIERMKSTRVREVIMEYLSQPRRIV